MSAGAIGAASVGDLIVMDYEHVAEEDGGGGRDKSHLSLYCLESAALSLSLELTEEDEQDSA